jgi:pyruvate-formate lyase
MAVKLMLETVPVHIYSGELIVGIGFLEHPLEGDKPRSIIPEDLSGEGYITGAHKRIATGLAKEPYDPVIRGHTGYMASSKWCVFPHYATPEEVEEARRISLMENSNPGHLQAGNPRLVEHGWTGLREMAENRMAGIDPSTPRGAKQTTFLSSVIIVLDALRAFSLKYSSLASQMAEEETEPGRKSELMKISEACRSIAERPPETFHEALQIHWLTHLANHTQGAHQSGRFDQYLWPFLEGDLEAGRLTPDGAQELLDSLWFKYASFTDVDADNLQNIILGGQTPDGRDATNPLTHMCLDSTHRLELIDPKVSMRIHRGTPEEVLRKTCEIIAGGVCHPGIYNDEAIIPALVKSGIPLEDARDYTNDGCSEILVQGKTNPWAYESRVKLLTCLESVSERLEEYESFEEVMAALKEELSLAVTMATSTTNLIQAATPLISPNPLISATVGDCIEKALDLTEGGAVYNTSAVCASGVADTADGLAALKKLVYEEKARRRPLVDGSSWKPYRVTSRVRRGCGRCFSTGPPSSGTTKSTSTPSPPSSWSTSTTRSPSTATPGGASTFWVSSPTACTLATASSRGPPPTAGRPGRSSPPTSPRPPGGTGRGPSQPSSPPPVWTRCSPPTVPPSTSRCTPRPSGGPRGWRNSGRS